MNPYFFTDWLVFEMQLLAEKLYKKGFIWRPSMELPEGVAAMFPSSGYIYPLEAGRRHEYDNLKNSGVGLMIYTGVLNGKAYVQDVQDSNIGSFNIDDASLERKTIILIDDRNFAEHTINELFQSKENITDIKVPSEIKYSVVEKIGQIFADAIDFVT